MTLVPHARVERARAELEAASVKAAQSAVDSAKASLEQAVTPIDVAVAQVNADTARDAVSRLLQLGGGATSPELLDLNRQAQALALEVRRSLGERVVERHLEAAPPGSEPALWALGHVGRPLADEFGVERKRLSRSAQLAIARRADPPKFDGIVKKALDADKPIPIGKLRALAPKKPKDEDDEPEEKAPEGTQVKIRLKPHEAAALDRRRTTVKGREVVDRTAYVKGLVDDDCIWDHAAGAARLVDRAIERLRAGGAQHKRVADRLGELADQVRP